jgi:hypothetical protein
MSRELQEAEIQRIANNYLMYSSWFKVSEGGDK